MDTGDECVGFEELEGLGRRAGIDDGAVVARASGGCRIAGSEADEPGDEGVFADVAEGFHQMEPSGIS
jgi:hypothetical protein